MRGPGAFAMEYLVTMTTHVPDGTPGQAVNDIRTRPRGPGPKRWRREARPACAARSSGSGPGPGPLAFARHPSVQRHDRGPVIDGDCRVGQLYTDPVADEPGRNRVLAAPHRSAGSGGSSGRSKAPSWPSLIARLRMRRRSSASSHYSNKALSSSTDATAGACTQ